MPAHGEPTVRTAAGSGRTRRARAAHGGVADPAGWQSLVIVRLLSLYRQQPYDHEAGTGLAACGMGRAWLGWLL